mmetsp:Transcript_31637/g.87340  ORF Transcript_31637/g.87340 Transcript_31637/m.87340 type:complete len:649 (-) Transcript_31637:157-2103(-)
MSLMETMLNTGELGVGLGFCTTLLQLHLGVGLLITALGIVNSSPSFAQLRDAKEGRAARLQTLQVVLHGMAAAAESTKLLAVFALIQARGRASDVVTFVGLCLVTGAVLSCTLLVFLVTSFVGDVVEVNHFTGDVATGTLASRRFVVLAKLLSVARAIGQFLLCFAAPPAGVQLLVASAFVRVAFAAQALGSLGRALGLPGLGALSEARADVERMVNAFQIVGDLALLDHIAWGPSSSLFAPLHPVLYCATAGLAHVGLVGAVHVGLLGKLENMPKAELDFRFTLPEDEEVGRQGARAESIRRCIVFAFYVAMLFGIGRIVVGLLTVTVSATGLSLRWGEPLVAVATFLALLRFVVYSTEYGVAQFADGKGEGNVAAAVVQENPEVSTETTPELEVTSPGILPYLKCILMPGCSIALAMMAMHTTLSVEDDFADFGAEPLAFVFGIGAPLFRSGFVMAAFAVVLQVVMLLAFALRHLDTTPAPEPTFDCMGNILWEPSNKMASKALTFVRRAAVALMVLGLLLGLLGMGVFYWAVALLVAGPLVYFILPPVVQQAVGDVFGIFASTFGWCGGWAWSRCESWLVGRRVRMEAAAAERAMQKAFALEKEWSSKAPENPAPEDVEIKGGGEKAKKPPGKKQSGSGGGKKRR